MPALADLLHDLAQEARPYGDPAAAVRTAATNRRRRRVGGPIAAAAVLIMVGAAIWGPRLMPIDQSGGHMVTSAGPDRIFPYPSQPVPLLETARALPADEGIGVASFVRVREGTDDDGINIVMPTGRQYQVVIPDASPSLASVTLSPDGRFLLWATPGGAVLRDLTGTSQIQVQVSVLGWRMWAPDSSGLLGMNDGRWWMLDPLTGHVRTVPDPTPALLMAGGRWLGGPVPPGTPDTEEHDFAVRDPSGAEIGRFIVDPRPLLADTETVLGISTRPGWVTLGIDLGIMSVGDRAGGGVTAFIVFSLHDGHVVRRVNLPDPLWFHQTDLMSWDGNLLVLTRTESRYIAIVIVDPATGEQYEVSQLEYGGGRNELGHVVTRGAMATWD
jgi:hypothetical protein